MVAPLKIGARVEIDTSQAVPAAAATGKALAGIGDAASKSTTELQKLIAASTVLHTGAANENARRWTGALADEALSIDRLRAKYNPLFATIQDYKQAQIELRTAHAMGALSADEFSAAMARERQAALASIDAIKGRNKAIDEKPAGGNQRFQASNLAFQVQDIVTTGAFMPWYTVALQQGPQVAAVMDSLEDKSAGLKSAFMSLITPWSLLSVAAVGAAAFTIQYFAQSGEKAKTLDDILAKNRDSIDALGPAYKRAAEERRKFEALDVSIVNARLADGAKDAKRLIQESATSALAEIQKLMTVESAPLFGVGAMGTMRGLDTTKFDGAKAAIDALAASVKNGKPEVEAFQNEIVRLVAAGALTEEAGRKLRTSTDALLDKVRELAGSATAVNPVADAFAKIQTAIDDINPGGAAGRLGKVDDELNNLFRNMKSGETTVRGLNLTIANLSTANPDLSKALEQIRKLTLEAMKAAGAVRMINGQPFTEAGPVKKAGRNELRSGTDADLNFFLRTDKDFAEKLKQQREEQEREANKAGKEGKSAANAYRDLVKSADDRVEQMKLEAQLAGQTGVAADALRFKLDLLQQSEDKGRSLTPKQVEAINARVEAFKQYAEQAAKSRLAADLLFEREQLGRSGMDQQIASTLKGAGLPVDFNSYEAGLIRTNLQLQYARDLTGDFVTTLASGIQQGKGLWESLGDAAVSVLKRISETLLNDVLNSLFKVNGAAAGGGSSGGLLGGLLGGIGSLFGIGGGAGAFPSRPGGLYDRGGYTGPGGVHEPRGVVHAGEVVFSQKDVSRNGGVAAVEAMRLGYRGYDDGGIVGVSPLLSPRRRAEAAAAADRGMGTLKILLGLAADANGNIMPAIHQAIADNVPGYVQLAFEDFNAQLPDRVAEISAEPWRR